MPQVVKNIPDNSSTDVLTGALPFGSRIIGLTLCNAGTTPVTISLKKIWEAPHVSESYCLLDDFVIVVNSTMVYASELVGAGYVIRLLNSGGPVDLDMEYVDLKTQT